MHLAAEVMHRIDTLADGADGAEHDDNGPKFLPERQAKPCASLDLATIPVQMTILPNTNPSTVRPGKWLDAIRPLWPGRFRFI